MIKRRGDLFTTDAKCIGHGVNTHGVMGAGIAKIFRDKYPMNYQNYRAKCLDSPGRIKPGDVYSYPFNDDGIFIFNIVSQDAPGPTARYDWLFKACLESARRALFFNHQKIAIPQIGCGIGGLEWEKVEILLRAIEIIRPGFEWEVWQL